MASSESFRLWAEEDLIRYHRLLGAYESGRLTQGEQTDSGELIDRTPDAIAHCKRIIADLEKLLND